MPCTRAAFEQVTRSPQVADTVRRARTALDSGDRAGYDRLKRALPAFVFQATFDVTPRKVDLDGTEHDPGLWRRQTAARLNGLVMLDYDHVDGDPRAVWARFYADHAHWTDPTAHADGGAVMLAHVTPSGHGLRLVVTANAKAGNLADNQRWYRQIFGLECDAACKNADRTSFAVPESDILFINNDIFDYDNEEFRETYGAQYRAGNSNPTHAGGVVAAAARQGAGPAGSVGGPAAGGGATPESDDNRVTLEQNEKGEYTYHGVTSGATANAAENPTVVRVKKTQDNSVVLSVKSTGVTGSEVLVASATDANGDPMAFDQGNITTDGSVTYDDGHIVQTFTVAVSQAVATALGSAGSIVLHVGNAFEENAYQTVSIVALNHEIQQNPLWYVAQYNVSNSAGTAMATTDNDGYFFSWSDAMSKFAAQTTSYDTYKTGNKTLTGGATGESALKWHLPIQSEWWSIVPGPSSTNIWSYISTDNTGAYKSAYVTPKWGYNDGTKAGISESSYFYRISSTEMRAIRFLGTDYCSAWKWVWSGSTLTVSATLIDEVENVEATAAAWYTAHWNEVTFGNNESEFAVQRTFARLPQYEQW